MALLEYPLRFVQSVHPAFFVAVVPAIVILVHFIPWLVDPHGLRSFPGPWIARFSDLWLGRVAQQGHRSEVVHRMHKKYGEHDQHVSYISSQSNSPPPPKGHSSASPRTTSPSPIPRCCKLSTRTAMAR
jgi:hypothetical protein